MKDLRYLNATSLLVMLLCCVPLSFSFSTIDYQTSVDSFLPPFSPDHLLGTDALGRDVFTGLMIGFRNSFFISLFANTVSIFIGVLFGLTAGYFGDRMLNFRNTDFVRWVVFLLAIWFFGFHIRQYEYQDAIESGLFSTIGQIGISASIVLLCWLLMFKAIGRSPKKGTRNFPLDSLMMRLMEVFVSVPKLLVLFSISAITKPSAVSVVLIIGLMNWPGVAKLVRAETMKMKENDFIDNLIALGYPHGTILRNHVLRNITYPILVTFALDFSAIIMIESSLSFLNIGLPTELPSLGRLLSEGRNNWNAWWLVLFPGLLIFGLVYSLNLLSEMLNSFMNVKNQA